jgi:hypothetical protein
MDNAKITLTTKLYKDDVNPLEVKWGLEYEYQTPEGVHPDNWLQDREEIRSFGSLISVDVVLSDKISVPVTEHYLRGPMRSRLEADLMEAVEYTPIEELAEVALVSADNLTDLLATFQIRRAS